MSPPTRNGRPGLATETARKGSDTHGQRTALSRHPAAYATAYAPCGRRTLWLVIVPCPHCRGSHVHRARSLKEAGGARRPGCRPGAAYWVVVSRIDTEDQAVTA